MSIYTEEELRQFDGITDEEYYTTVHTLYDLFQECLNHARICEHCDNRLWTSYCDGHVADHCLDCPPGNLEELSDGFLDLAGYITEYPLPKGSMPDWMEFRRFEPLRFINGFVTDGYEKFVWSGKECEPHYKPQEGYYRMKVARGTVTGIDGDNFKIDGKIDALIGITEVKGCRVWHKIQVGDVVEYNLGCKDIPLIARRV